MNGPGGVREDGGCIGPEGAALVGGGDLLLCPVGVPQTGQAVGFPQSSVVQFRHRISTALIFVPASLLLPTLSVPVEYITALSICIWLGGIYYAKGEISVKADDKPPLVRDECKKPVIFASSGGLLGTHWTRR